MSFSLNTVEMDSIQSINQISNKVEKFVKNNALLIAGATVIGILALAFFVYLNEKEKQQVEEKCAADRGSQACQTAKKAAQTNTITTISCVTVACLPNPLNIGCATITANTIINLTG